MNRLDFNKELYLKEIERKKSLNDALSIPIGIITGQAALLYFLYDNFEILDKTFRLNWQNSLLVIDIILLLISIFYLTISFYQPVIKRNKLRIESFFDYQYIDLPNRYEQYFQDTINQNIHNNIEFPIESADSELENVLIEDIVTTASHNINLNDIKTERIAKAKLFLVISVFVSIVLVILIFVSANKKEKEPQKIELTNPIKIENMSTRENQDKPKEQPKEQPKPKVEPKAPERPKIRIIPEGKEPPKGKPLND